jgi:hypothetical protein
MRVQMEDEQHTMGMRNRKARTEMPLLLNVKLHLPRL